MKKKLILLTTFALVALLVAGGTMAWFTANDKATNFFKVGTVKIKVIDEFEESDAQNVNPGQCIDKKVKIKNIGSKDVYVRVRLNPKWYDGEEEVTVTAEYEVDKNKNLKISNIERVKDGEIRPQGLWRFIRWLLSKLCPEKPDKPEWISTDDYCDWVYYSHYLEPEEETEYLIEKVFFHGETMGNDIQGLTFKLEVEADAVQASHNAYKDVWKDDIPEGLMLEVHPTVKK